MIYLASLLIIQMAMVGCNKSKNVDPKAESWAYYAARHGLISNYTTSLAIDLDNKGLDEGAEFGVRILTGKLFQFQYPTRAGLPPYYQNCDW